MTDIFTISDVDQLKRNQTSQFRLAEFRERADILENRTHVRPLGFFEFEKESPTLRERSTTKMSLAGVWAAAVGGLIGAVRGAKEGEPSLNKKPLLFGVGIGAALGLLGGSFLKESEASRVERALNRYEAYLGHLETEAYATFAPQAGSKIEHANTKSHAETVLAARTMTLESPTIH